MNLVWWIYYSCLALSCPFPVLDTLWILGNRAEAEFSRILDDLWPKLVAFGFTQINPYRFESKKADHRGCRTFEVSHVGNLGFSVSRGDVSVFFRFKVGFPLNDYSIAYGPSPGVEGYMDPFSPDSGALDRTRWVRIIAFWLGEDSTSPLVMKEGNLSIKEDIEYAHIL